MVRSSPSRSVRLSFFLMPLLLLLASSWERSAFASFRVVLDPGHGGSDEGAVFKDGHERVTEKDLTLLLSRQVAQQLKIRGVEAILTRSQDQELALPARTALANRVKADLFLSIHMNSSTHPNSPDAEGIETYILNNTTDMTSKRLAHFENSVLGGTPQAAVDSPQELDVALILKDLRLDGNQTESKRIACQIQENLVQVTKAHRTRNRGVRQALFYVLLGADMPSALIEAGFINNAKDRTLLLSEQGQKRMAVAIAQAVDHFRQQKGTPEVRALLNRCQVH